MLLNGFFVSDLHLFARRSQTERHSAAVLSAAGAAELFVLGGDIFDFRWTTLGTVDQTIEAALRWLDDLVVPHPTCQFHFVLGNHDYNARFIERLEVFAAGHENLFWHRYYTRIGDSLFLHGDVADRKMSHRTLVKRRSRWSGDHTRARPLHALYDLALQGRLHKLPPLFVHRRRMVARRIAAYLSDIGQDAESGLRHVYFGHTHDALANYRWGELRLHNGGAPIGGLDFRVVPLAVSL